MTEQSFLSNIRDLITRDELPTALKMLRELLAHSPKLDEALQQAGRFENIRKQIRLGTISHTEANLTQNQIRAALFDLLREIENSGSRPDTTALRAEIERAISIVNSKNLVVGSTISAGGEVHIGDRTTVTESQISRLLRLFLYLFVPLLAIGAVFFWQKNRELSQPLQLKVRVENRTPNPELLELEAKLSLTFGQKTETKTAIGSEALFEGIPANFRGEHLRLQFSAEGFLPIDTAFSFDNQLIVLAVRRNEDLATLSGIITDDATRQPLDGVSVSISCCQTLTDAAGKFTLRIPPEHQRLEQRLDIFKNGFETKSVTTAVIPGETLRQHLVRHR